MFFALDVLVVFVAFASDDDDVVRASVLDGDLNGLTTIRDDGVTIRTGETSLGIVQNDLRVFGARIVGGEHADVTALLGSRGHFRTLGAISISTAAEDGDDAVRAQRADGFEGVHDAIRRVRVVHVDLEACAGVRDAFEASGHLRRFLHVGDGFTQIEAGAAHSGQSSERVVHIEIADERRANEKAAAFRVELELRPGHVVTDVVRTEVAADAETVFDDATGAGEAFDQFATPKIVRIDHQRGTRRVSGDFEELHLGLEVLLHRAVVVEMVLREVGEDGGGKRQAMSAMLIERVRRNFHRASAAAMSAHLREQGLDFEALRRGVRGRHMLTAKVVKDGAEQSAAHLAEIHQMMREEGGGGFSIRASDADERHVFARMAV